MHVCSACVSSPFTELSPLLAFTRSECFGCALRAHPKSVKLAPRMKETGQYVFPRRRTLGPPKWVQLMHATPGLVGR
jgi:hypothetical protein